MAEYKDVKEFLKENGVSAEEMDKMWAFMYDKNILVAKLTDCGKDWSDLNNLCKKSLIKIYQEECENNAKSN
jgi:hypothetical protein